MAPRACFALPRILAGFSNIGEQAIDSPAWPVGCINFALLFKDPAIVDNPDMFHNIIRIIVDALI